MKKQNSKRRARNPWILALVVAGFVLGCPSGQLDIPAIDSCYAAEKEFEDSYRLLVDSLIEKTNEERAGYGLAPLTRDETLSEAALLRACEQQKQFAHTRPDGTPFYTIFTQFGIDGTWRGENLARGKCGVHNRVIHAWMDSEGHRANLLNVHYTRIGIGYVEIQGTGYWCQLFAS